jgi:hypothetical protein
MTRFANQIPFRYRAVDSATGVSRKTAKCLVEHSGLDYAQIIHQARRETASKLLSQYEADDGPLSANQAQQIRQRSPQGSWHSVRSSLIEQ